MAYKDLIVVASENDQNRINIGHIWVVVEFSGIVKLMHEIVNFGYRIVAPSIIWKKGAMGKQHRLLMKNLYK